MYIDVTAELMLDLLYMEKIKNILRYHTRGQS